MNPIAIRVPVRCDLDADDQRLVSRTGVAGDTRRTLLAHRMRLAPGDVVMRYLA